MILEQTPVTFSGTGTQTLVWRCNADDYAGSQVVQVVPVQAGVTYSITGVASLDPAFSVTLATITAKTAPFVQTAIPPYFYNKLTIVVSNMGANPSVVFNVLVQKSGKDPK